MRPHSLLPVLGLVLAAGCSSGERSAGERVAEAAVERLDRARVERTLQRLETIRTSLERYAIDHDGRYPPGGSASALRDALVPLYTPMLQGEDAWGRPFDYTSGGRGYAVVSAGEDGTPGTADDIALRDGAITGGR